MSDLRNLKLVHWNAHGARGKAAELQALLHTKHIDVALISETKLRDGIDIQLQGYCLYRQNKLSANNVKACHGLLVAVRQIIPHEPLPQLHLTSLDALGIQLYSYDGSPLRVYAAYKPPKSLLKPRDMDALLGSDDDYPTIVAGDMNSKHRSWNSVNFNPSGRVLYQHSVQRHYAVEGPNEFTYYPFRHDHQPNVLDIIMYRGLVRRPMQAVYNDGFGSDHRPMLVSLY